MGIASLPLEIQLILVPTILFALTFHEYAHARVAYLLGDYTSYYQNRMNLNPFNHLDPFGTFALYFLGFGWAKPVPVVMQNLKNPRSDMMMIAMAGPASNMFLACLASIIYRLNFYFQFSEEVIFPLEIFIQINIGEENQKSGIKISEIEDLLLFCKSLELDIVGLMCIPPNTSNSTNYFLKMKELKIK